MTCPRCGATTAAGAAFCSHCGAALGAGGSAAAPAAAAVPRAAAAVHAHPAGPAERSLHFLALGGVGCLGLLLAFFVLMILLLEAHSFAAFVVSLIMAVLPVPIYAALIVSLDRHVREPLWLLAGAFLWGAIVAVFFSFFINTAAGTIFAMLFGPEIGRLLGASLSAPFVEETSKGLALLLIFLFFRADLNDVVDGIVLGALVGLGFAMTENVLYFSRAYAAGGFAGVSILFFIRVILGGFGHALYTGATGAGLGLAEETKSPAVRVAAPILGWFTAMFLHFLWNTAGGVLGLIPVGTFVQLFVIVPFMTLFLTLPGIITLLVITAFAWRRESRVITEQLNDEVARGVVRPGEYTLLGNDHQRARRVWHILFTHGPAAWYLLRQFYNQEIALAFRKWHTARGERLPSYLRTQSEDAYRAHITAMRARLAHIGVPTE